MRIKNIKCPWLTRLIEVRQGEDKYFYDSDEYLIDMFCWSATPEGHDFWESVHSMEITNKEQALNWLVKEMVIAQNEDGTYFFVNESEADKLYNE